MRKGFEAISDFIFMNDQLEKADVILIPGSAHHELAVESAKLYHQGFASKIIPSGGTSKYLETGMTEYQFLRDILIQEGVNAADIIEESKAAHTFDNAVLSLKLMEEHNFNNAILVCKGYHSRRAYLTYQTVFPKHINLIVHSIVGRYQISKDNWYLDQSKIDKVMLEVEKIGKYFKEEINIMNNK